MSYEHKDVRHRLAELTSLQRARLAERLGRAKSGAGGAKNSAYAGKTALTSTLNQPPLVSAKRGTSMPLSWSQQRLWFLQRLDPAAGAAYHVATGLRLQGELQRGALQAALDALVARHEVLRTSFVAVGPEPVLQIAPAQVGFQLIEHDVSGLPQASQQQRMEQLTTAEVSKSFDLSSSAPIRGQLLYLGLHDHVLLVTLHHIVSDAWSIGILVREIAALYGAFSQGLPDPLPVLGVQYADYAIWQRQWLQGAALERQVEFWRAELAGADDLLELPTDRRRRAVPSYRGDRVALNLPSELAANLRRLSRRHGVTLFMTLLAGWAALLSRLSGLSDLVIGVPVANRQHRELESLIGFFANTLALRVRLQLDPSVGELLADIKEHAMQAFAHQDVPFAQVVEAVRPQRDLRYNPIFQVAFAFDNAPGTRILSIPGLRVSNFNPPLSRAKFDLCLSLRDAEAAIDGGLEYATDLFDRATIDRMSGHLLCVLEAMVADDHQRISSLNLLSIAQRQQLVHWPQAPSAHSSKRLIHEVFEAQAQRAPNAIAVVCEGASLTYVQLNGRANQLARALRDRGVCAEQRVGICMERGLDLVLGVLATLKAGGAYVPMDPSYSTERLAYIVQDAAPKVLLIQERVRARLPQTSVEIVSMDGQWPEMALHSTDNLDWEQCEVRAHHLAYVIYTSGSTGNPKGVMVEHGSISRLFSSTEHVFGFDERDVWTLFHSFAFDFSVWEMWGALCYGGRLVVVSHSTARSPRDFYHLVCEERVTVLNQTPSAFAQFIEAQAMSTQPHALRLVIFGGEALEFRSLKPWVSCHGMQKPRLVNMYGITETTVHVTYHALTDEDVNSERSSLIGNSIPDLKMYLLDRHRQPVPIGVCGEIYVAGAGVARGYLNRPGLTAERFFDDPFTSAIPPVRMYRTGDLARRRPDDSVEYLGRNDQQVKIRGFRIELGEIESHLRQHPQVKDARVVVARVADARGADAGGRGLIAYVIPNDSADSERRVSAEALRSHLNTMLPEYMIPSAYVTLPAFPLTANGKLDREALPPPDHTSLASAHYEAPQGKLETIIAQVWQDLLGVPEVGRHDNFFDLGGHSLLLLRVLAALSDKVEQPPLMAWLFQAPTPVQLAALMSRKRTSNICKHLVLLKEGADRNPLFCLGGFDGNLHDYLNIVRCMEPSQPIYGLQVGRAAENAEIAESVNARMENYVLEIRSVRPHGPYQLCGYSFGGSEAFELAMRLEALGEDVLLILLDAYRQSKAFMVQSWLPRILMMMRSGQMQSTAKRKLLNLYKHELPARVTGQDSDLRHALKRSGRHRKLHTFSGRVVLFQTNGFEHWAFQPRLDGFNGWKRLVSRRIEIIRMQCRHEELILEPAVKALAHHLNALLDASRTPT